MSYGGILTDYLIASDTRFAATSGAGTAFTVAFYGTDQYIIQHDHEIEPEAWRPIRKSYPFRMPIASRRRRSSGGERTSPTAGGQRWPALRSLGIDTQLVIHPNDNHGIARRAAAIGPERHLACIRTPQGSTGDDELVGR